MAEEILVERGMHGLTAHVACDHFWANAYDGKSAISSQVTKSLTRMRSILDPSSKFGIVRHVALNLQPSRLSHLCTDHGNESDAWC